MTAPLVLVLVVAAIVPAPAHAARGDAVIEDCTADGRVDVRYSPEDYRDALRDLPSDVDEYTDCREVIARAQRSRSRGGGGSAKGGSGAAPDVDARSLSGAATPEESGEIDEAAGKAGDDPVEVDGVPIEPGESGGPFGQAAATTNDLPLPLLLAALGLIGAAAAVATARGRIPGPLREAAGWIAARAGRR